MASKMGSPTHSLERRTLCFSSDKNHKLKVKLWLVGARERKKRAFFVPFILSEGFFFYHLCFLSMNSISNTIQNIHRFTYKKTLLHTLFCSFLKSSKAFSVSLSQKITYLIIHNALLAKSILQIKNLLRHSFRWHWDASFFFQ